MMMMYDLVDSHAIYIISGFVFLSFPGSLPSNSFKTSSMLPLGHLPVSSNRMLTESLRILLTLLKSPHGEINRSSKKRQLQLPGVIVQH